MRLHAAWRRGYALATALRSSSRETPSSFAR